MKFGALGRLLHALQIAAFRQTFREGRRCAALESADRKGTRAPSRARINRDGAAHDAEWLLGRRGHRPGR